MAMYDNILETIGNTPLVKLNKLAPDGVNVYVKIESFNPMGSVKDRMAQVLIEQAEASGKLRPGQTIIEGTSGNTGIALAMVCAQRGYPLVLVMAENFSIERRKMLRFLGAKVVLTPASAKGSGMLKKAAELADKHGYFLCRQFDNKANADAHTRTTAVEIIRDMEGLPLDYFVSGFGTGGTLLGVARKLRAERPQTRIVAAEPDNAPVLGSGIPQPRDADGQPSASHPSFRPHLMQGWSPDFVSALTQDAISNHLIDEIVPVSGNDAMNLSRRLAREEGIFVGTSSGATLAAALTIAERSAAGTHIVCMLPDTAERYLSTPLFDDVEVAMNDDENALSESTPNYRFELVADCAVAPQPMVLIETNDASTVFVQDAIENNAVVLFALEWCEFCWSVRKLFGELDIPYRSVDLDSVAYQENDRGGEIRRALERRTGSPTIPQVFIGSVHIGGATDLFEAMRNGSMQELLAQQGVSYDPTRQIDPFDFLPKWLQPRHCA